MQQISSKLSNVETVETIDLTEDRSVEDSPTKSSKIKSTKNKSLAEDVSTEDTSPVDELSKLHAQRMGNFKVTISYADAVYVRNLLEKSEYKGPQQAYLLILSKLEISGICEYLKELPRDSRHIIELSAATIESISFFMNNQTGKGLDSAQKLFTASMQFRPAIAEINKIEDQLETLKKDISSKG